MKTLIKTWIDVSRMDNYDHSTSYVFYFNVDKGENRPKTVVRTFTYEKYICDTYHIISVIKAKFDKFFKKPPCCVTDRPEDYFVKYHFSNWRYEELTEEDLNENITKLL